MAKDYFQSKEFKDILSAYEGRQDKEKSIYLDADDFADIADYYLTVDKPRLAMDAVRMGISIHPEEEVLFIVQSAVYIYQRMFDEAEELLAGLDASNPDVQYQLAQIQYAKYGRVEKAERMWRKWMATDGDSDISEEHRRENYIHIISSLAELRKEDGDEREDEQGGDGKLVVRKWIQEYIDTFQSLGKYDSDVQLVDICRENDLADLMCTVLSQVLEEQPYLHRGWSNLALAHFIQMDYEQALEACDFALAIDPDDMEALLTKAHTLNSMGEKGAAKPVFKEYLDKGGEVVQIISYAEILFTDGDKTEAMQELSWLSTYFEGMKNDVEKRWKKAQSLSQSELQSEEDVYKEFLDVYQKVYTDIAHLYHYNECFEESNAACRRILDVSPTCSEMHFLLGVNNLTLQCFEEASRCFASSLKWADDQVMTGVDIALTFMLHDFDDFALEILDAVSQIASNSNSPFVKNIPAAQSLTYLKLGNIRQFLHFFKIACQETPELVQKVYEDYFPKGMPISQWVEYAVTETDTLLAKFKQEDLHIAGFS